jgi:N-ethylmaleimide reductase
MTTTHASGHGALFRPYQMGSLQLPNRIVMAPLTRSRADSEGVPSPLAPEYYAQRSGAGLIIAEGTTVSRQGTGYLGGPGLYTDAHVAGWRPVTDVVHRAGGRIFVQLFHVGRMSHPDFHEGALPVGPSAIAAGPASELYDHVHPFTAAERALAAGFDGVEVHAANGYLLDQFLQDSANQRTDRYGGTPVNRARLLREVTAAVIEVWGADRVGVRISPINPTNGSDDSDPAATYGQAAVDLDQLGVMYLHVVEPGVKGTLSEPASMSSPYLGSRFFRPLFSQTIIAAGGLAARSGTARIEDGDADLVAYGKLYISNPDLPERFAAGAELTEPDRDTFYFGGAEGYTDYPTLDCALTARVA